MTNGEKIKEIFPNSHIDERSHTIWVGYETMSFRRDWWNAEYKEPTTQERQAESDKFDAAYQDGYNCGYAQARFDYEQEPTTKNDLGVDCISRADAIKAMQDKAKALKNEDTINGLCGAVAILYEMPSITPIRPKGHWILADSQDNVDVENGNNRYICSECTFSDIHAKTTEVPYCWHCGADMREVEE